MRPDADNKIMSTPKKYTHNSLFRPGPEPAMNACVGDNGGPYDFAAYAEGFFQAGFEIVHAIERGAWTIDLLVYPAVFDFRHGIELYLKHLTILANRLVRPGTVMQQGHGIMRNWEELKELFAKLNDSYFEPVEIGVVHDILEDTVAIDATGQVFRYPSDHKGKRHLGDISVINVVVLADGMQVLFDLFEKWNSGLFALLEGKELATTSV
jgi:hypothetical protein